MQCRHWLTLKALQLFLNHLACEMSVSISTITTVRGKPNQGIKSLWKFLHYSSGINMLGGISLSLSHPKNMSKITSTYLRLQHLGIWIKCLLVNKGSQGLGCSTGIVFICWTMLWVRQMGQVLQNYCASQKTLELTVLSFCSNYPLFSSVYHGVWHASKVG